MRCFPILHYDIVLALQASVTRPGLGVYEQEVYRGSVGVGL